jgi:hypothetical protein
MQFSKDQWLILIYFNMATLFYYYYTQACEVFILELTLRGWSKVDAEKRRVLTKTDITSACHQSEMYDFLVDIIPPKETKTQELLSQLPPQIPLQLPLAQQDQHQHQHHQRQHHDQHHDQHQQRHQQPLQVVTTSTLPCNRPIDSNAMAAYYLHQQQQAQQQAQVQVQVLPHDPSPSQSQSQAAATIVTSSQQQQVQSCRIVSCCINV